MLYKYSDNTYCISSHRMWLPGVYEDSRAAYRDFKYDNKILSQLQDNANKRSGSDVGIITTKDLDEVKLRMQNV